MPAPISRLGLRTDRVRICRKQRGSQEAERLQQAAAEDQEASGRPQKGTQHGGRAEAMAESCPPPHREPHPCHYQGKH